ncbi:MAG: S-layer homology domain-containing protein [Clostridia bacterium]|nr:S-layer homology domain-containing protein [Clostridia bacterium]
MKNASRLLAMLLAVAMFAAVAFTVSAFEDVNVEDDCYTAVNTLVSLNVIKGKTETEFAPDDAVTREQMAALMSRLYTTVAIEGGGNYTPFTDLDDPYYNNVISWCYDAGVINGTTPSTFEPKANIMLQDAVTMACRLIGYNDLTYPLGYLTKGRLIGLLDGLEEVAYDKELTRGETAILLYNTLDADGAEVISGSTVEWFDKVDGNGVVTDSYPLVVAYERNFTIAYDVYNFKTTTFQVVGTENFNLANYNKGDEDVLTIVEVNDKKQYVGAAMTKDYEDLMIDEETNSDDFILTYIDVLYKGDDINDEDTVILSTTVVTNTDAKDEIGVYYKKNSTTGKLVAQDNKILVNGKPYEAQNLVYTVDANGVITKFAPVADDTATTEDETYNLSDAAPIFFQADSKDEGKYAQLAYDLDNDGKVDVVMFIPAELHKITKITNKGEYTLKNVNDTTAANIVIKTEDENETKTLVILADEVAKDDYVLTYTFGNYTYIGEVLEPVITTVTKKSNKNYTLATGDVVSFAKNNLPVVAGPANTNLALDGEEVALYIVNGKIVYSDNATNLGYTPYTYAFVVNKADDETYVDVEDGTVEKVHNLIAFINGKAVTIPTYVDYSASSDWDTYLNKIVTVDDIKDGKYILKAGAKAKDTYYEKEISNETITYSTVSKLYKIGGKIITLDENSELYVRNNKTVYDATTGQYTTAYDTVKRYTMNNTPTTAFQDGQKIDAGVLRKNYDDDGKVESYTLVVGYVDVPAGGVFGGGTDYTDHRILLATGLALDTKKNASYATYDVLNPVTGDVETVVDTTTEVNAASTLAAGTVVKFKSNNKIEEVSKADAVFNGSSINGATEMIQVNRVINDNIVTFFKGNDGTTELTITDNSNGAELLLNGAKVVVLTLNDEGEYDVELTDDYSELEGKVVRIYTTSGLNYKAYYVVVLPYQWLEGALEDNKADDLFTNLDAYTDYLA